MGKRENKDIDMKWLIGCSAHYRLEKWLGANTQGKTPVFVWWCSPFPTLPPGVPKLALSCEWDMEFEPVSLLPWSAGSSEFCPHNPQGLNSEWSLHQCLCVYFFALGYVSRRWYPASRLPSSPLESDRSGLKFLSGHLYAWPTGSYLSATKPRDDDSTLQRGLRWKINWDKEPKIIRVGMR